MIRTEGNGIAGFIEHDLKIENECRVADGENLDCPPGSITGFRHIDRTVVFQERQGDSPPIRVGSLTMGSAEIKS
ncbi:hypothetical protein ACQP1O_12270 [Nocardia sp. CA-151230]|uniref:hypothetical protein n=1 Tax=Nocardia sp. CA-151230 TaxID=3239982 RepID=UPI003D8CE294